MLELFIVAASPQLSPPRHTRHLPQSYLNSDQTLRSYTRIYATAQEPQINTQNLLIHADSFFHLSRCTEASQQI